MYCSHCGREVSDLAAVCVGCGRPVAKPASADSASCGWWWLGFLFPVIGALLWALWTGDKPRRARKCGFGALFGVVVPFALAVLLYVGLIVLMIIVGTSDPSVFI